MTKMLEEAISKVRELPDAEQDEAAELLLSVAAKGGGLVRLDEKIHVLPYVRAANRDDAVSLVSDNDMNAFFKRHGIKRSDP